MAMLRLESAEQQLRDAIQRKIDRKHQFNKKIEEKEAGKSLIDRISLRQTAAEIKNLGVLLSELNKFLNMSVNPPEIPSNIKERLESIMSQVPKENAEAIRSIFMRDVRSSEVDQRKDIESQSELVQGLLKKNGFTQGIIYSNGMKLTYLQVAENRKSDLIAKLNRNPIFLSLDSKTTSTSPLSEDLFLENLQTLKPEQVKGDKNIQNILMQSSQIREAFKKKREAEHVNLDISLAISDLQALSIDFSDLIKMLQGIAKENQRIIQRCNDFLSKFDIEKAKETSKKIAEEKEQQAAKESFLKSYSALAYELEKAQDEGKSFDEIEHIQEKMRDLSVKATMEGAYPSEINDALVAGKEKYRNDKRRQETISQAIHEQMEDQRKLDADMNRILREMAIKELELTGAFEESYEWRNGDVRSTLTEDVKESMIRKKMKEILEREEKNTEVERTRQEVQRGNNFITSISANLRQYAIQDLETSPDYKNMTAIEKEAAIRKKMNELSDYASMTPEQRGLADFKAQGIVAEDTTLSDLRQQQLADFRVAYHDTNQDREIREIQRQISSQTKRNTNTIYKQYIRYLTSVEDKATAIKFSEYAKLLYGQDNLDLSDVEEEEKGKNI